MEILSLDDYTSGYFQLTEKLITINGKAYPKANNVVIMAGGAGSGKGFVIDKLLGIEGKVLDSDFVKNLAQKTQSVIDTIKKRVGVDISTLNMKNANDVDLLHNTLLDLQIPKNYLSMIYATAINTTNKPNIIIDTTLRDYLYFYNNCKNMIRLGYEMENIHIVWVVNDYQTAVKQNAERSRTVSKEVLEATHEGVAKVMDKIINKKAFEGLMDGDIWLAFNKRGEDSNIVKSPSGGSYIDKSNIVRVKKYGSSDIYINQNIINKINSYVPKNGRW